MCLYQKGSRELSQSSSAAAAELSQPSAAAAELSQIEINTRWRNTPESALDDRRCKVTGPGDVTKEAARALMDEQI